LKAFYLFRSKDKGDYCSDTDANVSFKQFVTVVDGYATMNLIRPWTTFRSCCSLCYLTC